MIADAHPDATSSATARVSSACFLATNRVVSLISDLSQVLKIMKYTNMLVPKMGFLGEVLMQVGWQRRLGG